MSATVKIALTNSLYAAQPQWVHVHMKAFDVYILVHKNAVTYQGVIDGVSGASALHAMYDAETDQVTFRIQNNHSAPVARALVAPELATALGLRQPTDLGVKPAKS